jgi:hypothetical protein
MKAFIQAVAFWLIQSAPFAVVIMLGIALKGCV